MSITARLLEEHDDELYKVQRIQGEYNIEIPEVLHTIFLYLDAREIIRFSMVSRVFRQVATSDLLWEYVMTNRKLYIGQDISVTNFAFFYDLNPKRGNVFERVSKKLQRGYRRKLRLRKQLRQEARRERMRGYYDQTEKGALYTSLGLFVLCLGGCALFVPPVAIFIAFLIQLFAADNHVKKAYNLNDGEAMWIHLLHLVDSCCCCFFTACGWTTCCSTFQFSCCVFCCCGYCCGLAFIPSVLLSFIPNILCSVVMVPLNIALIPVWAIFWIVPRISIFEDNDGIDLAAYILTSSCVSLGCFMFCFPIVATCIVFGCVFGCFALIFED